MHRSPAAHVPVIVVAPWAAIVSIGDLVKSRIDDLVTTTDAFWSTTIAGS